MAQGGGAAAQTRVMAGSQTRLRAFSSSLPMMLLRAREAVMMRFRASLRRHDMTEQQWRVLRALTAVESIDISALANATFLLGPSVSRIVRDLQKRKLVVRRSGGEDLRVGRVSISDKGLKLISTIAPESEAIYAEITRRFGQQRLAELQAMLVELEATLSGQGDGWVKERAARR